MAREFHVGEHAKATVKLFDADGNPTDRFDMMTGIKYEISDPAAATIADADAEPRDVEIEFVALTEVGVDEFLTVTLDGDPGDGVTEIRLESEAFQIVQGDAVSGTLDLELVQVTPPPPPVG